MKRETSETAHFTLRIREDLRRRLEHAARKRDVSLNSEMTERLRSSFEQAELQAAIVKLSKVATGVEDAWDRLARDIDDQIRMADLVNAAEHLIGKIRKGEPTEGAIEWVETAMKAYTRVHGRHYVLEPGEK